MTIGAYAPEYGVANEIAPRLRRLTARNDGPLTFRGTNSYLIGLTAISVIDPGPDDAAHVDDIIRLAGAPIRTIVITHDHPDHTGAAGLLAARTGAEVVGARTNPSSSRPYRPDRTLVDGDTVTTEAGELRVIATPGHTVGHLCFALDGSEYLFSGDHVMGWSTSVVVPPDGRMADYIASLERLLTEPARVYLPGHGGAIADGPARVHGLKKHRLTREGAILRALDGVERTIEEIVTDVYAGLDPSLLTAAALSVRAHVDWLEERGVVTSTTGRLRRL